MLPGVVHLRDKLSQFDERWSPRVIAELNDYQFKLAKLEGEFVWHQHDDTDEAFLVLQGDMCIDFEDGSVTLSKGDLLVVPKGVRHRPRADSECHVLLLEPRGVVNTGDVGGDLTAESDRWI